jgi:hypothetical protein
VKTGTSQDPVTPRPQRQTAGEQRQASARTTPSTASTVVFVNIEPSAIKSTGFIDAAIKALGDKKPLGAREGAAEAVVAVSKATAKALEPIFQSSIPVSMPPLS